MLFRKNRICLMILFIAILFLPACRQSLPADQAQETAAPPSPTAAPAPTLTPTQPPRLLTICLGQEPPTLYAYGSSSRSMWSVLEAVYDGPFDTRQFSAQPVILEKLPTFTDEDALIKPVSVQGGNAVLNTSGDLVALEKGTVVLPSGCSSLDCAVTWDGAQALQMDLRSDNGVTLSPLVIRCASTLSTVSLLKSHKLSAWGSTRSGTCPSSSHSSASH
jgi:peptide/nickel transport system substrate-binding protein